MLRSEKSSCCTLSVFVFCYHRSSLSELHSLMFTLSSIHYSNPPHRHASSWLCNSSNGTCSISPQKKNSAWHVWCLQESWTKVWNILLLHSVSSYWRASCGSVRFEIPVLSDKRKKETSPILNSWHWNVIACDLCPKKIGLLEFVLMSWNFRNW